MQKKRPLIKIPDAPNAPPETMLVYYKPPPGHPFWSDRTYGETGYPSVIVLRYSFAENRLVELKKPFYLSKTGMYCFRTSPALFNGMKEECFSQFHWHRYEGKRGGTAELVTWSRDYQRDKAFFLARVLRIQKRIREEELKKFVGGSY